MEKKSIEKINFKMKDSWDYQIAFGMWKNLKYYLKGFFYVV